MQLSTEKHGFPAVQLHACIVLLQHNVVIVNLTPTMNLIQFFCWSKKQDLYHIFEKSAVDIVIGFKHHQKFQHYRRVTVKKS